MVATTDGYVKAYVAQLTTAVEEETSATLPQAAQLRQPYPNPFNSAVNIPFSLTAPERVVLELFDLTGQQVAVLVDEVREAGEHVVRWRGEGTASGVYLLRLRVGNFVDERRMTLAK